MGNNYRIFETEQFQKDLKQIALSGQHKVTQKLLDFVYPQLREHPHFGSNIKKLKNFDPETWRYRIGSWRFFYKKEVKVKIFYILAATNSSIAY